MMVQVLSVGTCVVARAADEGRGDAERMELARLSLQSGECEAGDSTDAGERAAMMKEGGQTREEYVTTAGSDIRGRSGAAVSYLKLTERAECRARTCT